MDTQETAELLDGDGYPTEAVLETIKTWDHTRGWRQLLNFVKPLWLYSDCCYWQETDSLCDLTKTPTTEYAISTAGWSGNESLVNALMANLLFRSMCWVQSRRGGHYIFHVKRAS